MYREIKREIYFMKLFAKFLVLVLISVTLFVPPALAKDNETPVTVILEKTETVNHDYFAAGDTVRVSGIVNGDAYIAGGTVFIDGTINGDLLVAGGTVQINGTIKNDVRAVGGTVNFGNLVGGNVSVGAGTVMMSPQAKITGSLLAGAGTLDVYGPVGKGVTAGTGTMTLNNTVGGDVLVASEDFLLQPKTKIAGDTTYWSQKEATVSDNVALSGALTYHKVEQDETKSTGMAKAGVKGMMGVLAGMSVILLSVGFITLFLFGVIVMWLLPTFTEKSLNYMQKNPWGSFGLGIVMVIGLPILAVTALFTVVGIPLGIFLFMILSLLCLMGHIYAAIFVGRGIFTGFKADVHKNWHLFVGLVVLGIFTLIPVIGWLARSVFVLMGTGAVLFERGNVYRQMRAKHLI